MYHSIIRDRIRSQGLLHSAMFELTYRCNLDCFFCYNDRGKPGLPLTLDHYIQALDELAAMNVLFVTFTGGEPLMHPDFFAIASAARERGFAIRIKSGGHSIRSSVARRLKEEVNPFQVEVSLHGASADSHERQTRVKGSFTRLLHNIREMQSLGLRTTLVSTLTRWNESEFRAMYTLADELGVFLRWQGPVSPRDDGDDSPLQIQPSSSSWQALMAYSSQRQCDSLPSPAGSAPVLVSDAGSVENEQWCGAGSEDVLIDPFGSVFPCLHLRWEAGNLHNDGIRDIWTRASTFGQARELSRETAIAMEGQEAEQLGAPLFCPGLDRKLKKCGSCGSAG